MNTRWQAYITEQETMISKRLRHAEQKRTNGDEATAVRHEQMAATARADLDEVVRRLATMTEAHQAHAATMFDRHPGDVPLLNFSEYWGDDWHRYAI